MKKTNYECDRCHKSIDGKLFRVAIEEVDKESDDYVIKCDAFDTSGYDFCEDCAGLISEFVLNGKAPKQKKDFMVCKYVSAAGYCDYLSRTGTERNDKPGVCVCVPQVTKMRKEPRERALHLAQAK